MGSPPDARAVAAARARGIALEGSARQVAPEDFDDFDLVLAMDRANMRELRRLAPGERAAREGEAAARVRPGERRRRGDLDVPDPYYGAAGGFEEVLDLVQAACAGLLARIAPAQRCE